MNFECRPISYGYCRVTNRGWLAGERLEIVCKVGGKATSLSRDPAPEICCLGIELISFGSTRELDCRGLRRDLWEPSDLATLELGRWRTRDLVFGRDRSCTFEGPEMLGGSTLLAEAMTTEEAPPLLIVAVSASDGRRSFSRSSRSSGAGGPRGPGRHG